jgi:hypothetical protein
LLSFLNQNYLNYTYASVYYGYELLQLLSEFPGVNSHRALVAQVEVHVEHVVENMRLMTSLNAS